MTPVRAEQALPFAAFAQWRGASRLWQGQTLLTEQHLVFAQLCAAGVRVPMGTGVSLMALRHPVQAVLEARTLAAASGHPFTAVFGPGGRAFQRGTLGAPYPSPLTATREYLAVVRALLTRGEAELSGTYFSYHGSLPRLPGPPVLLGVGVLRPGMARLAGEIADVALTWLTPPAYLRDVLLPALREAAAQAGRSVPRVVSVVPTVLAGAHRDVTTLLADSSPHLEAPHYRDMLRRAGVPLGNTVREAVRAARTAGALAAGEPEEIDETLAAYFRAGADEVVVNCAGVAARLGPTAALQDLDALFSRNGW
ncbi:LLM class flavin-dependent oxidoreductase [Streptomyces sp. NPDC056441]|uniref:LLM class flavin-dependent oxidoreductase n=1 Tax=Streptomyces sp. NPDC056441 TaxID=3345817 RepID=UPI00367D2BC1